MHPIRQVALAQAHSVRNIPLVGGRWSLLCLCLCLCLWARLSISWQPCRTAHGLESQARVLNHWTSGASVAQPGRLGRLALASPNEFLPVSVALGLWPKHRGQFA